MQAIIEFDRCITCLSAAPKNDEHILPEALGGRLHARLLCVACNSSFGHTFIAQLISDPGVILAVDNLKGRLPALHASLTRNLRYVAPGPDGKSIEIRDAKLRARKTENGTILMDTRVVAKDLQRMLAKRGVSESEIESAVDSLATLPDGVTFNVGGGYAVRKTTIDSVQAELSADLVDDRWPVLVALEFLTLNVGPLVLDSVCDSIRSYLLGGELPRGMTVERLFDRGYEPRHAMYWIQSDESLDFYLRLFGAVVFRVRLGLFRLRGPMAAYVEELESGESLLSQNGLKGPFFIMNRARETPDPSQGEGVVGA